MSRAYRIRVKESLTRDVRAEDSIETCVDILAVMPPEQMAELLALELEQRGFERQDDGTLVRTDEDTKITVDPCSGTVTVQAESTGTVDLQGSREGYGYDAVGPGRKVVEDRLSKELKADLEKRAEQQATNTQSAATAKLEKKVAELQPEMTEVVNRLTADAHK